MANKKYFPIGSVVILKDATKRVMIYGRRQFDKKQEKEFDYIGCLYPEGYLGTGDVILFNHEDIQMVYFLGFQDIEEFHYKTLLNKEE